MRFRIRLWLLEIDIELPAPEQVSTADIVAAAWSAAQTQMPIVLADEPFDD